MKIYFDTSAFSKRIVEEPGSDAVERLCAEADECGISIIAIAESISGLRRIVREKKISEHDYKELKEALLDDLRDCLVLPVDGETIAHSIAALEGSSARGMDSIHIGSALSWGADLFVTADKRQATAAQNAGLKTEHIR